MHINEIVMRTVVDKKMTISDACIQVGVDRCTFMSWLRKNGRPDWFPAARKYKTKPKFINEQKVKESKKKPRESTYNVKTSTSICVCTKDRECAYHYAKSLKEEFGFKHDTAFSFDRLFTEVNYLPM